MDRSEHSYWLYWGKAAPEFGGRWHLAVFHCLDVASVAEVLVERSPLLRRKLAALWGVTEERVAVTAGLWCALHDVGKFDCRFQAKAPEVAAKLGLPEWGQIDGRGHDHGAGGYRAMIRWLQDEQAAFEALLGKKNTALSLLRAVCGHHGALPTGASAPGKVDDGWTLALGKLDARAQRAFVAEVLALYRPLGAALAVRTSGAAEQLLAGLCSVADWLGSQVEYESAQGRTLPCFTYCTERQELADYRERARGIAKALLEELPLGQAQGRGATFGELFRDAAGRPFAPRDVQLVTEGLALPEEPCLVVLEAAMGSGKTEAALSVVARWLERGLAAGFFVGMPTMATANGLLGRIESAAARLFAGEERVQLRLAHGSARKNDRFERLTRRALRGRSADSAAREVEAEVVCARWFLSPKRALLAQVGVGTVDQAMLAVLRARHNFVRLFGLSLDALVLDELHAYDAYMEVLLVQLVRWMGALRVPVILLSATLPRERRAAFASAYRAGLLGTLEPPELALEDHDAYPAVTLVSATRCEVLPAPPTERRTLALTLRHEVDPVSALAGELVRAAREGEMVVWVRNTVNEARVAYEALLEEADRQGLAREKVLLFHARFRGRDRVAREREVLSRFGREGVAAREGALLVATQVVEQSLDLDFDRMVTDLCPIDLLLQRAGRLWRWGTGPSAPRRPEGAREVLHVVAPPGEALDALRFGPSGKVYDPVTLWLSCDSLRARARVQIPEELRALVEATYHSGQRAERIDAAPCAGALRREEDLLERELQKLRTLAEQNSLRDPSLARAVSQEVERDDEEGTRALTRVGDTVTFLLVWWDASTDTARTLDGTELPERFDPRAPGAWKVLDLLGEELVRLAEYEWNPVVGAGSAPGEAGAWEQWRQSCVCFLEELHLRGVHLLPMSRAGETFRARVEYQRGMRGARYERARGFWLEEL